MRISLLGIAKVAVLAGGIAGSLGVSAVAANAQSGDVAKGSNIPDAQIEANVLRQLASAQELSTQNIQSTTVYGTVTLTGNVPDEAMRGRAENLAARAQGVKKVVDQLTLGDAPGPSAGNEQYAQSGDPNTQGAPGGQVLQSDGTYAPVQDVNQASPQAAGQNGYPVQPGYPGAPEYGGSNPAGQGSANHRTYNGESAPAQTPGYPEQPGYPTQPGYTAQPGYPAQQGYPTQPGYPTNPSGNQLGYGDQQAYNAPPPPPAVYGPQGPRQPMYRNGYAPYPQGFPQGGQAGGQVVTVVPGTVLQVRLDRGFDANHVQPGTQFSGVVMQDIVANGAVAIPRGAAVQGTVVDAKKAGVLKGEASLGLQIEGLTLGGQNYTLNTDVWEREGRDKTVRTVNSAVGLGALGAILGGVAGGGSGAAIGAGVGGAAGIAGSAASPAGRVIVPAEAVLTFRLAQPTTLTTVGQAELSRLGYAAGPVARPVPARRYYSPYSGYYGPGYYR